jgi:hypothetical protein
MQEANYYLKELLIQHNGSLIASARALDIREDRLSRIIHRRVNPSSDEKIKIASHLQQKVSGLF